MFETLAYYFDKEKALLFAGRKSMLEASSGQSLKELQRYLDEHPGTYKAIALSYDLKNEIERLSSQNNDRIGFPDLACWEPEHVFSFSGEKWSVISTDDYELADEFLTSFSQELINNNGELPSISFLPTETKVSYLNALKDALHEIQMGNTYEINYCQEFFAEQVPDFSSFDLIREQFELTQAPFSAFLKFDEFELFCGSPERFLKKENNKLISQPIKGTIARGKTSEEDERFKSQLKNSQKDRSENVMIVDLVRNDLSRIAKKGSVNVDELFGIHSFNTVHHMISTVSCELKENTDFTDILKAAFPMGSMTGAPKISTMNIIERLEKFKRGIYSGSVGYIEPNGNFDLNVVIRSIIKNNKRKVMSCGVGGAITIQSDPEKEYEECMVKIKKTLQLFGEQNGF